MEKRPLHIPASKRWKGLTVYCYKCKTNVADMCKESGKPLTSCPHGDKHIFKVYVHVPGTDNARKTKALQTRDIEEAVRQAIEFSQEVKQGKNYPIIERTTRDNTQSKPITLVSAMARYVGYLNNDPEIVPEFRRKERTKAHLKDVERCFKRVVISLKQNGYNVNDLRLEDLSEHAIGKFHEYLLHHLKLSNRSYNKHFSILTSFYDYLNNVENYNLKNPFKTIPRKQIHTEVNTITKENYRRMLKLIQNPDLGKCPVGKEIKNLYKPWMKDAVELGLLTGRRNEEIVRMKWKDIDESKNFIKCPDYKVNRQKGNTAENTKYIDVPITQELNALLSRLGINKYRGQDKYILAPDEEMQRENINRFMTRSFSHYYKQINTGENLSYKCLRKTYITQLTAFMGIDNARLITKHSGTQVMEQHYLDKKIIALTAKDFKMFSANGEARQSEIEKIRSANQEKEITIER